MTEPAALGLSLAGTPLPLFDSAPNAPLGTSPLRRDNSVRRTSSIDATWPDGHDGATILDGHARDVLTRAHGSAPVVIAEDRIHTIADHRVIRTVTSIPPRAGLPRLNGARAGGYLRAAIDDVLHDERVAGTPLYLLLDDLAGTTLVAGWAWSRWRDDWMPKQNPVEVEAQMRRMAGICIGFRPGSSALGEAGVPRPDQNATPVVPLVNPQDPDGWHPLIERGGVNFRRARRVDLWRDGDVIRIDSMFQDSASIPGGGRVAIHEYRLEAVAGVATGTLLSATATPGTLPYRECPAAPSNVTAMVGVPLVDMRDEVLLRLRKTAGCTHLNDALRALAEVPLLARALEG